MATFSINANTNVSYLNQPVYIGTLDPGTYPYGIVHFTDLGADSDNKGYWQHNSTIAEEFGLYLTNATNTVWNGDRKHPIGVLSFPGGAQTQSNTFLNNFQVEFKDPVIVGQPLYLIAYRYDPATDGYTDINYQYNIIRFINYSGITIDTENYYTACSSPDNVVLTKGSLGQLTVSWSGAQNGDYNPITSYHVYLTTTSGGSPAEGNSIIINDLSTTSYTFAVNNDTQYYPVVVARGTVSGYDGSPSQGQPLSADWYTSCSAPKSVWLTQSDNGELTIHWSGAQGGRYNSITGYSVYLTTTSGGNAASGLSATISTTSSAGSYVFTVNNTTSYYPVVITQGAAGSSWNSTKKQGTAMAAYYYTACGAPTSVTRSLSAGNVTVTWSGATAGTNNTITGYGIVRGANKTDPPEIIAVDTASPYVDTPGQGTYWYGVITQGSAGEDYYSDIKWASSSVTVTGAPVVQVGSRITKAQMDLLKTYLGQGTTVTKGNKITATIGNSYRANSVTAGTTKIQASWYNGT